MRLCVILAVLIILPIALFSQQQTQSFDRVLKKLTNKTWVVKRHVDGVFKVVDSDYYLFPSTLRTDSIYLARGGKILQRNCLQLLNYKYYRDAETGKIKFGQQYCNPVICFCDSSSLKDTYTIYANGGGGPFSKGNISFLSEDELSCNPVYGESVIFKSVVPPKEVLSVIPKQFYNRTSK